MQQQRAFLFVLFLLGLNSSKLTEAVTDVVEALTKNNSIGAINETNELILGWVEVALDHFCLLGDCETRLNAVLASDCFDLFNAGVC
jgi:hypothetical protein